MVEWNHYCFISWSATDVVGFGNPAHVIQQILYLVATVRLSHGCKETPQNAFVLWSGRLAENYIEIFSHRSMLLLNPRPFSVWTTYGCLSMHLSTEVLGDFANLGFNWALVEILSHRPVLIVFFSHFSLRFLCNVKPRPSAAKLINLALSDPWGICQKQRIPCI